MSSFASYAAAPTSRGHVGPILMPKCKKLHVPIAISITNLVYANPTPEGTQPLGLIPTTTSLTPPQKFSQSGKIL